jgi:6-pyruvoyltetrahydropterin/6-carboxytetrahydropterin synthase
MTVSSDVPAPFALEVECEFAAAHAILLLGERERLHGHNWRVVVSVGGDRLDGEELLCDFHAVERVLARVVAPFRDGNLNEIPPFDRVNPTAEALARHVAHELSAELPRAAPGVHLEWVRVTEAPRCTAVVRLPRRQDATP